MLTKAIVQAPNERTTAYVLQPEHADLLRKYDATYAKAWMVKVGPPTAELSVAVIEPGDYGMTHSIATGKRENGQMHSWPQTDWKLPAKGTVASPKGTILILHGYQDVKEDMIHWALFLAQAGYRVVLVDMRGHGRSTGDWISYGVFEVHDLEQVVDDLENKGLVADRLGILGLSYGASVGLELAGHDKRVTSMVAMEPFSNAREGVKDFARAVVPGLVSSWTDSDFSTAEDKASKIAQFEWKDADILESAATTKAPILYLYADKDHWMPPANSELLASRTTSPHSTIVMHFDNDGGGIEEHVLLSWILDPIAPVIQNWFDITLSQSEPASKERLQALGFPQ
ncbi:MAG TPA: alpha/beta fold hydrolase [Opitutaceae bacterium]|jgi:pimeloyl-ACP methyl ester carboxylesterase|nr:alpha/beta fold hydrolase [Opitutaceae bacterium]